MFGEGGGREKEEAEVVSSVFRSARHELSPVFVFINLTLNLCKVRGGGRCVGEDKR